MNRYMYVIARAQAKCIWTCTRDHSAYGEIEMCEYTESPTRCEIEGAKRTLKEGPYDDVYMYFNRKNSRAPA